MVTAQAQQLIKKVREQIATTVVGADEVVTQMLVAIMSDGHALLESVPGLGKTTLVKTVADVTKLSFSRVQNTPDLLPSDILGTQIISQNGSKTSFTFQEGPIFANIVLADEINRATPKTQAALLEVMQERQVTTFGETYDLDKPFFVLATQNPIDQEGTYPLPEAQTDRFLLKINVDYPSKDEEVGIVKKHALHSHKSEKPHAVLDKAGVIKLQEYARSVPISQENIQRIVDLVRLTRENKEYISVGASPRASIGLIKASQSHALLHGRAHVSKEDIMTMALPVLRHRIVLSFEAERDNKTADSIIKDLASQACK